MCECVEEMDGDVQGLVMTSTPLSPVDKPPLAPPQPTIHTTSGWIEVCDSCAFLPPLLPVFPAPEHYSYLIFISPPTTSPIFANFSILKTQKS